MRLTVKQSKCQAEMAVFSQNEERKERGRDEPVPKLLISQGTTNAKSTTQSPREGVNQNSRFGKQKKA